MAGERIEWRTLEHKHKPRSREWILAATAAAAAVFIFAVLRGDFLFGVFIILAYLVIIQMSHRTPDEIECSIDKRGVRVSNTLYPYNTLESFWVREEDDGNMLVLKSEKALVPLIMISLGGIDPEDVRILLLKFLKEDVHEKGLVESLADWFGL